MNESLNDGEEGEEGGRGWQDKLCVRTDDPPGTETCRRHCSKKEVEPADERDAPGRFLSETHRCTRPHRSQSHLRTCHYIMQLNGLFVFLL